MVKSRRTNVLFFPTVSAKADLESRVVPHSPASTTRLKCMNNESIMFGAWPLTKQVCSNTSEAYCGSLRSGGHSGMSIVRLAVTQAWTDFLDIRRERTFRDARAR